MTITVYDLTHTLDLDTSVRDEAARAWDECHAVATLQGVVNRDAPRLYLRYVEHDGRNIDDYWLEHLSRPGGWLSGETVERVETLEGLIERFRGDIAGAVVYEDTLPALSNVASSWAGVANLVAVRHDESPGSVYARLVTGGPRLPVKRFLRAADFSAGEIGSAKCAAYDRAKADLIDTGRCSGDFLGYYIDAYWIDHARHSVANHHTLTNHDYFVARRAFFCDLNCWDDEAAVDDPDQPPGTDLRTLQSILRGRYDLREGRGMLHVGGFTPWAFKYTDQPQAGGRHFGVQSEWELVRVISAYNGFLDADAIGHGAMANASFYMHYPLREAYRQAPWPTTADLAALDLVDDGGECVDRDHDYIVFYVGDYDAAAWLYQRMPDIWEDPCRGAVPLSWSISPVLCRRAPMVMAHLYETRSDNDFFMSADNGAGYLCPTMLTEPRPLSGLPGGLADWEEHCLAHYRQWDMSITGFVIDGRAVPMGDVELDAYARFSPNGVVPQFHDAAMRLHGDTPVLLRGPDINEIEPVAAAQHMLESIAENREHNVRFHWFRSVLRSPSWYAEVVKELCHADGRCVVLGAPTFFELLRRHLRQSRR